MFKTAFFYLFNIEIECGNSRCQEIIFKRFERELIFGNNRYVIVIEINNTVGKFNNRGCIRSDEVFTFAYTDNEWASFASSNKLIFNIFLSWIFWDSVSKIFRKYPSLEIKKIIVLFQY